MNWNWSVFKIVIQREALSLVNHLVASPSKEVEVGCKKDLFISLSYLCVQSELDMFPRCRCRYSRCPCWTCCGRWWPATRSRGRTSRCRRSSRWWTGSSLARWIIRKMQQYSLARSFAMTRVLIVVKGVWDCDDDALGALHLSILHGIQQGEHKVILIQKDCALKSFRFYGLATHMIYQREKETRSKRF